MTLQSKFRFVCIAWLVNAVLFCIAWVGGDIAMNEGYEYLKESIDAMRVTLSLTKTALSMALIIGIVELKSPK